MGWVFWQTGQKQEDVQKEQKKRQFIRKVIQVLEWLGFGYCFFFELRGLLFSFFWVFRNFLDFFGCEFFIRIFLFLDLSESDGGLRKINEDSFRLKSLKWFVLLYLQEWWFGSSWSFIRGLLVFAVYRDVLRLEFKVGVRFGLEVKGERKKGLEGIMGCNGVFSYDIIIWFSYVGILIVFYL